MRIIEYLFFKYYNFQVKVGNEDIAPITAILFISFIMVILYADILCVCLFYLSCFKNALMPSVYSFILVYVISFFILFFYLVYKKKYKLILTRHEKEWKDRKNIGAILFATLPIVAFFIEMFLKITINRSVL